MGERCDVGDDVFSDVVGMGVPQVQVEMGERTAQGKGRTDWMKEDFLRGPVPVPWLKRAFNLPGGRVAAVAMAVWWLAGVKGQRVDLKLTTAVLNRFGVDDRTAKSRALVALEKDGLISVHRRPQKNPLVTILDVTAASRLG